MSNGTADERRSPRAKVMLAAVIEHNCISIPVRIEDLSAHGARVSGDSIPAVDEPVTFRCKQLEVHAFVAWLEGREAGIGFGEAVLPETVLRKVSAARANVAKDYRRPGFRGKELTQQELESIRQWATVPRDRLGD